MAGPESSPAAPPTVRVAVYGREGAREEVLQPVAPEVPVTLYLNDRELVTLLCVGRHLDELAAGFLYGEGFLQGREDLRSLEVDAEAGRVAVSTVQEPQIAHRLWMKRTITSGCGKGSLFYYALNALTAKPVEGSLVLTPRQVLERVEDLSHASASYRRTRGVHTAGLATAGEMIAVREDIGRHNAVDMVVGHCFLRGLPLADKLLVATGRLTSEIVIKAARLGLSTLVSLHAASSLAVELATSLKITLIGGARGGKFTVYGGEERLRSPEQPQPSP